MALTNTYLQLNIDSLVKQNKELTEMLDGWHEVKSTAVPLGIDVSVVEKTISDIAAEHVRNERTIDVFNKLIEAQS